MSNLSGKYAKCTPEDDDGEFIFKPKTLSSYKLPDFVLEPAFNAHKLVLGCKVVKDMFGHYQLESNGSPKHVEA